MAKEKKKRAEQYDPKLVVKGDFLDVINASLGIKPAKHTKPTKGAKKG